MRKKIERFARSVISWVLIISMMIAVPVIPAEAATSLPTSIYLTQEGSTTCTLSATAMMMRARMYLSNNNNWSSVTESSIKATAWISGSGLRHAFTYSIAGNSMSISHKGVTGMSIANLKTILNDHPEGIVLYVRDLPHAVFLTDYDGDTFYCADPLFGYSGKRISLAESYLGKRLGSQANILSKMDDYWYISSHSIQSSYHNPEGVLDGCTGGMGSISIGGWAFDRDDVNAALEIHVYMDGKGLGACTANLERTDVNNVYGTGNYHGFEKTFEGVAAGTHSIEVYAINVGGGVNNLIGSATVVVQDEKNPPVISDVKVEGIDINGYTVLCKITDDTGLSKVEFPTWTEPAQDDITWEGPASVQGDVYRYRVNASAHNNERGEYMTHIYAYDRFGNKSSTDMGMHVTLPTMPPKAKNMTDNFYASVKNAKTGTALTNAGDKDVVFSTYSGSANQIWHFIKNADGSYRLSPKNNAEVSLDVYGAFDNENGKVQIHPNNDSNAQKWDILEQDEMYYLKPWCSETRCLDLPDANPASGTGAQIHSFNTFGGESLNINLIEKKVTGISVTTKPNKTEYFEGESFSTEGMVVTASYNDGTTAAVTDYTTSYDFSTAGAKKVTITYKYKEVTVSTTVDVTVVKPIISGILVATKPKKVDYYVGDKLETTGMTLKVNYNNGETETVTSGFTCSPATLNNVGTQTITVSYGEKQTTFDVTVKPAGGSCGTNVNWELDKNGTLTISGSGKMTDYGFAGSRPWNSYAAQIKKVVVEEGVTNLGNYALKNCTALTEVSLPKSLTKIGDSAFYGCSQLTQITIPENVTVVGAYAFSRCKGLKKITFIGNAPEIGTSAFSSVMSEVWYPSEKTGWTADKLQNYGGTLIWTKDGAVSDSVDSGSCGTNVNWKLSKTGILTISGSGKMMNYGSAGSRPWGSYTAQIKKVVVENGVTGIGSFAFYGCVNLKEVILADSVVTFENYAFKNCSSLTKITLPGSLKKVGESAFYGCGNLESIVFSVDLTGIGAYAFSRCASLNEIEFAGNAPEIGTSAFSRVNATVYYPAENTSWTSEKLQNYGGTLNWVKKGGDAADVVDFGSCGTNVDWKLSKTGVLTISGSGKMTNYSSSGSCPWNKYAAQIKKITVESGVTRVGSVAFCGCTNLTEVILAEGVTTVGNYAFKNCSSLIKVTLPETLTTIGESVFYGCGNLGDITFPETLASIGAYTFSRCKSLGKIEFTGNAPTIGTSAFSSVTAIVYYPSEKTGWTADKLQNYGGALTWMKKGEEDTNIVDSGSCGTNVNWTLNKDGILTISGNGKMKNYTSAASRPWNAYAAQIKKVVVETGVTEVGNFAFYGCSNLCEVTFAEGITRVGNYGFKNCSSLTKIVLPNSLTVIGESTFYGCGSLGDITFSENLTGIGAYAFSRCGSINKIEFTGNAPTIGTSAFSSVKATVYYPSGKTGWSEDKLQNYGGTLNWIKQSYILYFDANEGACNTEFKEIANGDPVGELPLPTKDYFDFNGWYTKAEGGDPVTKDTVFDGTDNVTIYAHWTPGEVVGWTKASDVPSDAQIVERKWTYTLRSYTTSGSSSLDGWTHYDTQRTSWGGTQGPVYSDPSNGARNVWSEQYETGRTHHWVYYRWANASGSAGSYQKSTTYCNYEETNLTYQLTERSSTGNGQGFKYWHNGTNYRTVWYLKEYDDISYGTRWYYQDPVYTYYFYKDENKEAASCPSGNDISNVQEWVKYREK